MAEDGYRFIENPDAIEIVCHHLHDVEILNGLARFCPVVFKNRKDGVIAMPPCYISLPVQAVEPALIKTWQKLPTGVLIPALGQIVKRALLLH